MDLPISQTVGFQVPSSLKNGKKGDSWFMVVFYMGIKCFLLIVMLLVLLVKLVKMRQLISKVLINC